MPQVARIFHDPEVEAVAVPPNGGVPNHPAWPALIYRRAVDASRGTGPIKALFAANGWRGLWEWGVFGYHHFHPDGAEVLGVAQGTADLQLGGPEGPVIAVGPGDVLILPAGFGHRNVRSDPGFTVVGGYPEGQTGPEIWRPNDGTTAPFPVEVARVPRPVSDPVFGVGGPLLRAWAINPDRASG